MADPDGLQSRTRKLLGNLNPYSWVAVACLVLGTTYYFMIPYQVDKPMLVFGQALMDMKPRLLKKSGREAG